jgi:hypothetical protein
MIMVAKISSGIGFALLLLAPCAAIGALLVLPFGKLIAGSNPQAGERELDHGTTMLNDAGVGLSLLAWPMYAFATFAPFAGEIFTRFSTAGLGYVYITFGMPAFLAAWLGLVIYACIRPTQTSWLFGAIGAAAVIIVGYANIG